ncbi:MAG: bifunctional 2-C-methyl-D-erythritol 4-phosphate cytidylyltransferase/2-C-methyl-D-erythritol 2,4-cyclodiphosphate synthase [Alphaproteobacteria bacterium]|jgi:2-C-methyl-D-erythritol 4-phosphate cytidylyltransferase / 2-C-methyl-D-erythritol 2,4-cyclodiphosphate synthase|nr:bifunctional 2-C-methyl-D-erythritol 4-phosphate cytidylyltransferase/2-C-methyl-D-erythritol 2,4-cyclodiphosphate synthase [Alphaproteobacteria bacterium]MBT4017495.1 bifunctional 2-C-methyl-D-erythritol 4-phosphate cytidylyltransferase/2-C-methyl-D-erythritol 2,4-cyclodiphosphate synthase [Alphaproteobacteria bacterium]MBT4967035.1 bifunctional 2-C-methyl-D-erythritol 4-phosphate cytidylyltransferase/2-C-methyl-D-erythritol 2,4-cyclodiphosphate synthase [Alphaproteobacteria bacterium]MBT516
MTAFALIVAAGRGARMRTETPKQYLKLGGVSILRRTVLAFLDHPGISGVQVVYHPDDNTLYQAAVDGLGLPSPVSGGDARQDSVRLGLEALADRNPIHVLIHDAARPFVSKSEISNVLAALDHHAGAISALPVVDTVKRADDQGVITATESREGLWRALTPQGFKYSTIMAAHKEMAGQNLTDDAALAEAAGLAVRLVHGSQDNFKITSQEDMERAEAMVRENLKDTRTGQGFDAHKFSDNAPENGAIVLGGVPVPHDFALAGHSDADVALHALTDAILGGLADHDIGHYFPPGDDQWKGASSDVFLTFAKDRVAARDGVIAHVDLTIICERPKVGPHRDAMRSRIAQILEISLDRVGVKATTTEKMGFTGRGEGIAAQATATIRL